MSAMGSVLERQPVTDGVQQSSVSVNDLAIRVGTVNGSGSQSANLVLLRALYSMGIPCSGKNVFPSNIEGLPTWFHIRASERGYVGHRLDTPILVCMNEQTAADDLRKLQPGSICIYRDDFDMDGIRDDVQLFPVPFTKLVEEAYPPDNKDKSYRDKLRKVINMVYVGVVSYVCGIEIDAVEDGIRGEFSGRKAKAGEINVKAATPGLHVVRRESAQGPAVPCPPDRRHGQPIAYRGEQGRGLGSGLRGSQRADMVPDYSLQQSRRVHRGIPQKVPGDA